MLSLKYFKDFNLKYFSFYLLSMILSDVSDISDIKLKHSNVTLAVGVGAPFMAGRLTIVWAWIITVKSSAIAG